MTRVSISTLLALATVIYGYPSANLQDSDVPQTQPQQSHIILPRRVSGTSADVPAIESHPDLTQVVTRSPAYAIHGNVRQDSIVSEEDLQSPRRRREASESSASENEDDDDSDMFLEPDEQSQGQQQQTKPSEVVARYEYGVEPTSADNHGYGQHFFPSFAPVFSLGHSRPPQLYHQEPPVFKPRSQQLLRSTDFNPFRSAYRESNFQAPTDTEEEATSSSLLGSGNFGVIRGGTYYNDDDRSAINPYYSNGHGRPGYGNPLPQKFNGGDFFANFRDFADINTPTKASFSEFVIVYVNKNGSHPTLNSSSDPTRPKNIIEQLSLLDKQDSDDTYLPEKKSSTHKKKLAILRRQEQNKVRKETLKKKETAKDLQEPLLALS